LFNQKSKHIGESRGVYRVLVGKPECKTSLGRPRRRWEGIQGVPKLVIQN